MRLPALVAALGLFISSALAEGYKAVVNPANNVFPSMVIALSRMPTAVDADESPVLGDPAGLIGVTVKAPADNTDIRVEVRCDEIMDKSTFKGTLKKGGETYLIQPKIRWSYDLLQNNRQPRPVDVRFKVAMGDEASVIKDITVTLHSINTCPFAVVSGTDENRAMKSLHFMFAAYVNEDHPWVDLLLKEALDTRIVNSFAGYQEGDPNKVSEQVFAIWNVLQRRGVKYSSITETSAVVKDVASQHVRLLDESIRNTQANCVDGSVVFASVLRKLGLHARLVLVPGHCFVAYALDDEGKTWQGLETTMLGNDDLKEVDASGMPWTTGEKVKNQASLKTFIAATKAGTARLSKELPNFEAGKNPTYQLVDMEKARQAGILPISFGGASLPQSPR